MATTITRHDPQNELGTLVKRWNRRFRWQQLIKWLPRAIIPGILLGVTIAILSRLTTTFDDTQVIFITAGAVVVGLIVLIGLVWLNRDNIVDAARRFDLTFGLQERISTALELMDGRIRANDALVEQQVRDAYARAQKVDAKAGLPFATDWREWAVILVLVVIFGGVLGVFPAGADEIESVDDSITQAAIDDAEEALMDIIEDVATDTSIEDEAREELLETLQVNLETLQDEDITEEEALATLNDVELSLQERAEQLGQDQEALEQAIESALENLEEGNPLEGETAENSGENAEGAGEAGEQMSDMLEQLAESLENLSQEQLDQLAESLEQAADALEETNPEAAEALRDAAEAARDGDTEAAQEALQEANDSLQQQQEGQQQQQQAQQNLQQSAQQAQQAQQDLQEQLGEQQQGQQSQQQQQGQQADQQGQQQAQQQQGQQEGQQGESGQQGQEQGQQSQEGEGQNQGEGQGNQASDAQQEGGASSESQQSGQQSGQQEGQGESNQAGNQSGSNFGDTSGSQQTEIDAGEQQGEGGERDFEQVFDPRSIEGSGDRDIILQPDDSDTTVREGDLSENPTGNVTVPYNQVFSDYSNAASEALESGYVPLGMRDIVRNYFSSLAPSGSNSGGDGE